MNHPFKTQKDRARLNKALDSLSAAREEIDDVREWLAPQIDASLKATGIGEDCSCIHDEVFELDALLFAAYRMLHLMGSGMVTHLTTMDNHEIGKLSKEGLLNLGDVLRQVIESPATNLAGPPDVAVEALPIDIDDKGPGPNGVH